MKKELIEKIIKNGGIYDTAKYRYKADADGKVRRANLDDIGTTAILDKNAWTVVGDYTGSVFGAKENKKMKLNGKIYGNEKTHLRLSSDGQDIYDSTCPLRIVEHEIRDDNDEIVDYRYSVTGCLGDRRDLTEEDLEQFLLDSMPSYFFPDAEYVDDWFGSGDPVCMSAYEVNRLIREWTQPDGEPVDYWSQLHKASVDEINKYDFCD